MKYNKTDHLITWIGMAVIIALIMILSYVSTKISPKYPPISTERGRPCINYEFWTEDTQDVIKSFQEAFK